MTLPTGRPVGRPPVAYSRRKYQEAVSALKATLRSKNTPAHLRIRATELLLACYGTPVEGEPTKITAASVKELVSVRVWEKALGKQVREKMLEQEKAAAIQAENQQQEEIQKTFAAVLDQDQEQDQEQEQEQEQDQSDE